MWFRRQKPKEPEPSRPREPQFADFLRDVLAQIRAEARAMADATDSVIGASETHKYRDKSQIVVTIERIEE